MTDLRVGGVRRTTDVIAFGACTLTASIDALFIAATFIVTAAVAFLFFFTVSIDTFFAGGTLGVVIGAAVS